MEVMIDHIPQDILDPLVSDFHRNMIKGGIYMYPKSSVTESGKLRLLYECNPMAFLAEQANGLAIGGKKSNYGHTTNRTAPKGSFSVEVRTWS